MASARRINDVRSYCDVLFDDLSGMKSKLLGLIEDIDLMQGRDKEHVSSHARHLRDIANTIDWKLEILTKVCPTDWMRYAEGAERASVRAPEKSEFDREGEILSPGNVGG